jgi:hypothetical protein
MLAASNPSSGGKPVIRLQSQDDIEQSDIAACTQLAKSWSFLQQRASAP